MFNKIFSKSRKKSKPKIKPKIIADIHEKNSLILAELTETKQIELEIKSLKIADYLIGNIAIERKTINDFISSMINKRLLEQLKQLQKYKQKLIILEGNSKEINKLKNPSSIRGFILSISLNYQIPVIMTKDSEETAQYLITLAKQQLKKPVESSLHSRIPKTTKEQKHYVLEAFPNIGPITSKKLIKEFKNLKKVFNATEEDLSKILKSKVTNFKKLLDI
jgi:ERCC4-type nuclease